MNRRTGFDWRGIVVLLGALCALASAGCTRQRIFSVKAEGSELTYTEIGSQYFVTVKNNIHGTVLKNFTRDGEVVFHFSLLDKKLFQPTATTGQDVPIEIPISIYEPSDVVELRADVYDTSNNYLGVASTRVKISFRYGYGRSTLTTVNIQPRTWLVERYKSAVESYEARKRSSSFW